MFFVEEAPPCILSASGRLCLLWLKTRQIKPRMVVFPRPLRQDLKGTERTDEGSTGRSGLRLQQADVEHEGTGKGEEDDGEQVRGSGAAALACPSFFNRPCPLTGRLRSSPWAGAKASKAPGRAE